MDHGSAPMETPFMARKQGSLVVNELDCQSSRFKSILGVQIQARVETWTVHCKWEDETVMEKTGHPLSYAEKMTSLALQSSNPWLQPESWLKELNEGTK